MKRIGGEGARWSAWGPWLALVVAGVVCLVAWRAEHALAGAWGFALDDTWIHCQIARNLIQGQGWSYNPGVPVQNSSGPLWTAVVALGFAVAGTSVWVPKALGALCFLACVGMTARLARLWSRGRSAAVVAAFLAATSVPLAWHGLSAMETSLAALLVAATLDTFYRWRHGRRRWLWPVLAALAGSTRPETLVVVPLLCVESWRLGRVGANPGTKATAHWGSAVVAAGIALFVLLPYIVFNLRLSGSPFPTTFAAKVGATGLASALRHGDALELVLALSLYPYIWSVHTLAYWGILNVGLLLAALSGGLTIAAGHRRAWAPGLVLLLLPALRGVMAPHALPGLHEGRYIGSLLPVYYACAAVGLVSLCRLAPGWSSRRARLAMAIVFVVTAAAWIRLEVRVPHVGAGWLQELPVLWRGGRGEPGLEATLQVERRGLFLALLAPACVALWGGASVRLRRGLAFGLVAVVAVVQFTRLQHLPRNYARNVHDIQRMDVTLGRWVHQHVPQGAVVAVNDIGAIAYFGARRIVDLVGLATPELVPYKSAKQLRTLAALRRLEPRFCIVFTNWFPEWMPRPSLLKPIVTHRILGNTILGGSEAVVFALDWERFTRYYSDALLVRLDPAAEPASWTAHAQRGLGNLGLATRARLFATAGDKLRQRGDLGGAESHYRRALAMDSEAMPAWRGLLELYQSQQRWDDLGRAVQEMVRRLPDSSGAHEAHGQWLAGVDRREEAVAAFERALALHPDNTRLLAKLERTCLDLGDTVCAAFHAARRLELESPSPPPLVPGN